MRPGSVYLWWPNLIGYFRVLALVAAMQFSMQHPIRAGVMYSISQLLDAADGTVARRFSQCSQFGLLIVIAIKDPASWQIYSFFIVLDLVSHWAQMYSTMLIGGKSHKENNTHPIMKFYYKKPVLFSFCLGNEAYIVGTYLSMFFPKAVWLSYIMKAVLPIFLGKNLVNVVQLIQASNRLVALDAAKPE